MAGGTRAASPSPDVGKRLGSALASATQVQLEPRDGLHGVGDESEELHAFPLVVHPPAVGLEGEVEPEALPGDPDLARRPLGIHHHLLPRGRRHRHHVPGAVRIKQVRVDLVQRAHQRLEGGGHQLVVPRLVHAPSDAQRRRHRQSRLRKEEELRAVAVRCTFKSDDSARRDGAWEGLEGKNVGGHGRHRGVVAHQDEVLAGVLGQKAVETAYRHVGKEAPVRAQRHSKRLCERQDLRRLDGADEWAREDERDIRHARLKGRKVGPRFFSRPGGERARRVVQAFGNVGIRVGVPHQENLHRRLQPVVGPFASVVHERARQGQSLQSVLVTCSVLLLCSAGCRTNPATQAASDGGADGVAAAFSADAGTYRLTAAKLDAFLEYKRAILQGGEPSAAQLRELLRAVDAGEPDAVERAWAVLHALGAREVAARVRSGLSPAEVRTIESMASDVAAARVFVRPMGLGKLSEDLAAARNSLPADRRAAVDATLESLKQDEARIERLADEREAWGDANVDLLLTREKELVRLYEAQLRGARERLGAVDAGR
jgi:hypothetical protein